MSRAALHLHSTWSDGELTLDALRELLLRRGYAWALMADHAPFFDEHRAAEFAAECAAHSDDRLRFIPGLEFDGPDRMHIVGYGVTRPLGPAEPEEIIAHIRTEGGVSVIAHPKLEHFPRLRALASPPDGIEVWNAKYDGRFAPRPATFELLREIRRDHPHVLAFYGLDLHWRRQFAALSTRIKHAADPDAVLNALRAGAFTGHHGRLVLPSDGRLDDALLAGFQRRQRWHSALRRLAHGANRGIQRLGGGVPAPLKAQARRWL